MAIPHLHFHLPRRSHRPSPPLAAPLRPLHRPVNSSLPFPSRQSPLKTHLLANTNDSSSLATSITTELGDEIEEEFTTRTSQQPHRHRLPDRWHEIHGKDDWAGLLDPMDPLLRAELIRYGEFAQACYDAYDYDPFSRYCGSCKYNRRKFFSSLGMDSCGYEVTRYLYATSIINLPNFFSRSRWDRTWSERANWIGYVAVSSDEMSSLLGRRDIVIAWRGTVTKLEWIADLMDFLRPVASEGIRCPDPAVKVESGFVDLYTDKDPSCRFCKYSAREQALAELKKLIEHYSVKNGEQVSISVTGHSLGSALAMLSAYDLVETGVSQGGSVCVFSFSGPRVGNKAFKERFEGIGVKALRVVNVHDTVPKVPGVLLNERVPPVLQRMADGLIPWSYCHVGVELALDHKHSPFLKDTGDPSCLHNLEALLHLLDGPAKVSAGFGPSRPRTAQL